MCRTNYTRYFIHEENGIVWAYASNICFNFKQLVVEAFGEPEGSRGLNKRLPHFQWRWAFKYQEMPIPVDSKEYPIIEEDGSWLIIPGWLRHTSHFAQNAIMINYYIHHKEILPPVVIDKVFNSR